MSIAIDAALVAILDRVRAARADRTALNIIGGNTKSFYGEAPVGEPLLTREMRGIRSYEPSELVVTARAGTPLAELEAALAEKGQCLAFEPPRFAEGGTVGGMVAAGLAGPSRAAAGSVRDHLLGATLLNGRAEVLNFGGTVMKNVAGYDVSRLLAGSLGLLGVILEVSLKVLPTPPASATLRFDLGQAEALAQLNAWGGQPLPIHASAWWNDTLVLRLCGARAAVQAAATQLGGERLDAQLAAVFWQGLRDQSDEFFAGAAQAVARGATLWRLSLPQVAPPLKVSGEQLIEWGGAQRWVVTTAPAASMRDAATRAGGHASVFRGDKSAAAFSPLAPTLAHIHRELKAAFDPDRVFNPGRMYREL